MAWGSLTTLVTMFAPRAFLDSQEVNFPASTNDFVSQVGYQVYDGEYYPPGWSWSAMTFGPNDYLSVPSTVPPTFQAGNLANATAYVHVQAVQGEANLVDIQYWLFYNFNGTETLRAEPLIGFTGEMALPQSNHWGDWECVIVRVNSDLQVVAVCFSQHSTEQWCLPGEMSFTDTTHPNVYVSRGSHANRPTPGGPFWIKAIDVELVTFGPVDYADGAGQVVDYSKSFVIVANNATQYFPDQPADPGWLKFLGTWGQPLSTTASPQQVVDAIILVAKAVPLMIPFVPILLGIAAVPALAASFVAMLIPVTQNAPTNPPTKGLWKNSLPLNPALAGNFAPTLAPFAQSEQTDSLSLVYVVNNSSNQLLAVSSADGQNWSATASVHQTSRTAPTLASFNDALCLAFISNDSDRRILTCQSTDGQTWSGNSNTGQKSPARPGLTAFNSELWLAFIANDSSNRLLICSSGDGKKWSDDKQITGQATKSGPALATFNANLWVAFVANNTTNQLLVCSSPDGQTWSGNALVPGAASTQPLALAAFNNQLWLAFIAADGSNKVLICSSADGQFWTALSQVGSLTSPAAPTLTVFNETLWLGCLANDGTSQVTLCFSPDGKTWTDGSVIFPPST